MRIRSLAAALVGALVAGTVASAPPARADGPFHDTSFEVVAVQASPAVVTVKEMQTVPVTITMTTRTVEGQQDRSGTVMALSEDNMFLDPAAMSVTLQLVGQEGSTKHWRGVVNVGGRDRTVAFDGAYNCELGCNEDPTPIAGPQIRVRATDTPVITFAQMKTVNLASRTYAVRGRVLKTSKRSFGRRLTVVVGHATDCGSGSPAGTVVRTTLDGRFKAVLKNPITMPGEGAAMHQGQCAKVLSDASDIRNRRTYIAYEPTQVPWKFTLPVRAPKTIKRGKTGVVTSAAAPLGMRPLIVLDRLYGRNDWQIVQLSETRASGRVTFHVRPLDLGRHVYRLRSWESTAFSKPFTMATVR